MSATLDDIEGDVPGEIGSTAEREWWRKHTALRWVNYPALRFVDKDFVKWRKSKISPGDFGKYNND